jgi:hypothetical protein
MSENAESDSKTNPLAGEPITVTQDKGNAFCRHCGVRGYSKNLMSRSVFSYPSPIVESFEYRIRAHTHDGQHFFGLVDLERGTLAQHLIEFLRVSNNDYEGLKILLCVHSFRHDEGFTPEVW